MNTVCNLVGSRGKDILQTDAFGVVKSDVVNTPVIDEFPYVMVRELAEATDTENMYAIVRKIVDTKA
jgi:hypothetical protein